MAYENVLWEVADGIGTLTVNRPKQLNALDQRTLQELGAALDEAARDPAVRAVVVTGAGEKAFVAGADIAAMAVMGPSEAREFAALGHRVFAQLEALPVVTIAAVNGFALGGGCELTLACDLVYASERAKFGQPEVNLGLIPGFGGTQRLTRRVGLMRAKELVLTGESVDAAAARAIGLALDVVAPAALLEHARARARAVASRGPAAVAQAKKVMQQGADLALSEANALERQGFAALFGGEDAKEGMRAFLEKRPAQWSGR
ncbi:enoyl-CoA hydratase-related protein [Anaeromyxobacter sp. PSR-1]|uniref:enoyl-CoA hydratase-related protein n=1 Tax=unclassified Anaeromyxobacter TaxID=2620896 RepID=UPI0005DCF8CC|nr:enoyl-CoA hydratase-related protein [Anaeromyxobacter sp. PSR-1]GAO04136.1 3-hydroxybutyryl-CoA dehydratase [Anaeromyxobacter sp. PSR-1]